ncbi:hypothetical protein D7X55_02300 [Corallococcus sp. AB049A]|nr:hypothetical protein D7X55_02300 [Corallococcus sp. AB049A]
MRRTIFSSIHIAIEQLREGLVQVHRAQNDLVIQPEVSPGFLSRFPGEHLWAKDRDLSAVSVKDQLLSLSEAIRREHLQCGPGIQDPNGGTCRRCLFRGDTRGRRRDALYQGLDGGYGRG